jgi:hypothetical protein
MSEKKEVILRSPAGEVVVKKQVEDAHIVQVPPYIYNTVESFIKSQLDRGIKFCTTVTFIKPKEWTLRIHGDSSVIAELRSADGFFIASIEHINGKLTLRVMSYPEAIKVDCSDYYELNKIVISGGEFSGGLIPLSTIAEKFFEYFEVRK